MEGVAETALDFTKKPQRKIRFELTPQPHPLIPTREFSAILLPSPQSVPTWSPLFVGTRGCFNLNGQCLNQPATNPTLPRCREQKHFLKRINFGPLSICNSLVSEVLAGMEACTRWRDLALNLVSVRLQRRDLCQ